VKKSKIADKIFLVRTKTQYELTATFLRFQEHYESPKFHGKIFSLETYMDWYAKTYGNFTYYSDWSGFNLPSSTFKAFYDGKFDPLSEKEQAFLRLFENETGSFYVIGVYGDGDGALIHEKAHALFSVDDEYKKQSLKLIRKFDTDDLRETLLQEGYTKHVLDDEVQAYMVEGLKSVTDQRFKILRKEMKSLYKERAKVIYGPAV
jgi:hypothetical protein